MKVSNMTNVNGNKVANQFIITGIDSEDCDFEMFQSYKTAIAKVRTIGGEYEVLLDKKYWDHSATTGKYRNQFLGRFFPDNPINKGWIKKKIASGEYKLVDLN